MTDRPPVFLSEEVIAKRVKELGEAITRDLASIAATEPIVCVGVLKGTFVFFADLIRQIDLPIVVDFLGASSYGQRTTSSGVVQITLDLSSSITGRHVLVVEDVIDTGLTLHYLLETLRLRKPASLRLCSLLLKPASLKKKFPIDYLGFTVDDRFLVGYGLDAAEKYRNLPYLAVLPDPNPEPKKEKR